jgi:hypothetical protein
MRPAKKKKNKKVRREPVRLPVPSPKPHAGRMRVDGDLGDGPIAEIAKAIGLSVVLCAPERHEQMAVLMRGLTLTFTNEDKHRCACLVDGKTIFISRGLLEHLWASAHAIWVVYDRHLNGKKIDKPLVLNATDDPVIARALHLLSWSLRPAKSEWPNDSNKPTANPAFASDEQVATELMLMATAFLLHHELAHYRLSHPPTTRTPESIENERDADREAARWLLESAPEAQQEKRLLGVAIGLAALVCWDIRGSGVASDSHPRPIDRWINTLSEFAPNDHHPAWAISAMLLKIYLDHAGIRIPEVQYESTRAVCEAIADVLAERSAQATRRAEEDARRPAETRKRRVRAK